jgi:hypothetical protein
MSKRYVYMLACPDEPWWPIEDRPGELINEMQEESVEVTYQTMQRHCQGLVDWLLWKGVVDERYGMVEKLRRSSWIAFKKGFYDGMPCYFVDWSGIEYIWIDEDALEKRDIDHQVPPWEEEKLLEMGLERVDPRTEHLPDFPMLRVFRARSRR